MRIYILVLVAFLVACTDPVVAPDIVEDAGQTMPTPLFTAKLTSSAPNNVINWGGMARITIHLSKPAICKRDGNWLLGEQPISPEHVWGESALLENAVDGSLQGTYAIVAPSERRKYTTVCTSVDGEVVPTSITMQVIPRPWSWIGISSSPNDGEHIVQPKCVEGTLMATRESDTFDPLWDGTVVSESDDVMDLGVFLLRPQADTKYTLTCIGSAQSSFSVVAQPR